MSLRRTSEITADSGSKRKFFQKKIFFLILLFLNLLQNFFINLSFLNLLPELMISSTDYSEELVIGTFTIFQPIESLYRSFYSEIQNVKGTLKHNSDRITNSLNF